MTGAASPIPSPCNRVCCLDDEDVCLGCYRHVSEITGWRDLSDADRRAVLRRCAERSRARNRHVLR